MIESIAIGVTPFFANGIRQFTVSAETPGLIDPNVVGLPFVHGYRFMTDGVADVWEQTIPVQGVPEPRREGAAVGHD